jgi:hypothetical protein
MSEYFPDHSHFVDEFYNFIIPEVKLKTAYIILFFIHPSLEIHFHYRARHIYRREVAVDRIVIAFPIPGGPG